MALKTPVMDRDINPAPHGPHRSGLKPDLLARAQRRAKQRARSQVREVLLKGARIEATLARAKGHRVEPGKMKGVRSLFHVVDETSAPVKPRLDSLTVADLRRRALDLGCTFNTKTRKADLVGLIEEATR